MVDEKHKRLAAEQFQSNPKQAENREDSPGTTSRASKASLYSMKPKPFMSLISVISPVPWVAKWASTSALVAVERVGSQRYGPAEQGKARKSAPWIATRCC